MGVALAGLDVVAPDTARNQAGKHLHDVFAHALVRVLVDDDGGGGSLGVDIHQAVGHAAAVHGGLDPRGDVDQLLAMGGGETDGIQHAPILHGSYPCRGKPQKD